MHVSPVRITSARAYVALFVVSALCAGCASHKHRDPSSEFSAQAPFSKTFSGSGDAVNDQSQINQERANIRTARNDIAQDHSDIRTDQHDIQTDRKDIRTDRRDLRADGYDFRNPDPHGMPDPHGVQGRASATTTTQQGLTAGKSPLTATTLANNAADNNKKATEAQNTHKAWYHFWW